MTNFEKIIKKKMIDNEIKQIDIAKQFNVTRSFISELIKGKKHISLKWLNRFIQYFNFNELEIKEIKNSLIGLTFKHKE